MSHAGANQVSLPGVVKDHQCNESFYFPYLAQSITDALLLHKGKDVLHVGSKTQLYGQVCLCILQDGQGLVFGANVSQSRAIEELQKPSQPQPFQRMADHLLRIAGIPCPPPLPSPLWACPIGMLLAECRHVLHHQ